MLRGRREEILKRRQEGGASPDESNGEDATGREVRLGKGYDCRNCWVRTAQDYRGGGAAWPLLRICRRSTALGFDCVLGGCKVRLSTESRPIQAHREALGA